MKKITKFLILGLSLLFVGGTSYGSSSPSSTRQNFNVQRLNDKYVPSGDLKGGAKFSVKANETDFAATMKILPTVDDFGSDGFFLRLMNNTGVNTPLNMFVNGKNGHRVRLKTKATVFTFDASGANKAETLTREFGSYLMIAPNFNGYMYLPLSVFESLPVAEWGGNTGTEMNWSSVYRLYFALSTKYDNYGNISFGDMFTESKVLVDTSSLNEDTFATTFNKDYQGEHVNIERLNNEKDFNIEGKDLNGGLNITVKETTPTDELAFWYMFGGNTLDGDNIVLRVKNNEAVDRFPFFYVNSRANHRVGIKVNSPMFAYNLAGEAPSTLTSRNWGHYLTIPASFDGFICVPKTSMESVPTSEWGGNVGTEMNWNDIYGICMGISTFYDAGFNVDFGDIFTNTDTLFFNGEDYTKEDFATHVGKDYNGQRLTYTQLEGMKPSVPAFDYTKVEFAGDYNKGVQITSAIIEADELGVVEVIPTNKNMEGAIALSLRIKNISGDYPFQFFVSDTNGNSEGLSNQATATNKVKLINANKELINATPGGNPVAVKIPANFDGWMIIPVETLSSKGTTIDFSSIAKFEIKVAIHWDFNFNNVFGDMAFIKADATYVNVLNVASLSDETFATTFKVTAHGEAMFAKRYIKATPSTWMGDVKVLDTLNFEDDATLKKYVTTDPNDNLCSYEKSGDGIKVDVGPYEAGHAYGSYMALAMFDKGLTTDRKVWNVNQSGESKEALGISVYLKNLSRREIGINIQFDETAGSTPERWIVKQYPAPYLAFDVVKKAFYGLTAKSDQIQIPVGFEGYVRIPFTSYSVPDWCHGNGFEGTDDILDISKVSGNFFLTSDNTRFEGLSFFVKELGIYFNETVNGSIVQHEKTIASNMGIEL